MGGGERSERDAKLSDSFPIENPAREFVADLFLHSRLAVGGRGKLFPSALHEHECSAQLTLWTWLDGHACPPVLLVSPTFQQMFHPRCDRDLTAMLRRGW